MTRRIDWRPISPCFRCPGERAAHLHLWNIYRKENASAYWSTGSLHHYRWTCGVYRLSSPLLLEMEEQRQWPTRIKAGPTAVC